MEQALRSTCEQSARRNVYQDFFFISLPASGFLAGWEAVVLTHLGPFEVIGLVLRTSPFPGLAGYCF